MPLVLSKDKSQIIEPIQDMESLILNLKSKDYQERLRAVRSLAKHPQAITQLSEMLITEKNTPVREAIFTSLMQIGDDDVVCILIMFLKSEDPYLRNSTIEALQNMPKSAAIYVEKCLFDTDVDVRLFTVNILLQLNHPNVFEWITELLKREQNVNVCAAALDVLAEVGTEYTIPLVLEIKTRFANEPFIDFAANVTVKKLFARVKNK